MIHIQITEIRPAGIGVTGGAGAPIMGRARSKTGMILHVGKIIAHIIREKYDVGLKFWSDRFQFFQILKRSSTASRVVQNGDIVRGQTAGQQSSGHTSTRNERISKNEKLMSGVALRSLNLQTVVLRICDKALPKNQFQDGAENQDAYQARAD